MAIVSGVTLTDFAMKFLTSSGDDVLEKHQNRAVSNRDHDDFLATIENPVESKEALKKSSRLRKESDQQMNFQVVIEKH